MTKVLRCNLYATEVVSSIFVALMRKMWMCIPQDQNGRDVNYSGV